MSTATWIGPAPIVCPNGLHKCRVCCVEFKPRRPFQAYCSNHCRLRRHRKGVTIGEEYKPPEKRRRHKPISQGRAIRMRIIAHFRNGRTRQEILDLVKCSMRLVDSVISELADQAPREVPPYKCVRCDAAGVYFVSKLNPCQLCRARDVK